MSVNIAALRAKLQELKTGKNYQNTDFLKKFWNPPFFDQTMEQRSIIRVLPSNAKDEEGNARPFYVETYLHKLNNHNIHCPKKTHNTPCPICEYISALWAENDPTTQSERYSLKAKQRYYMNIISRERIVLNTETNKEEVVHNDGPLIYSCGTKVLERIIRAILKKQYGDITDLNDGYDFRVEKEQSTSGYPSYDNSEPVEDSTPAGTPEQVKTWMESLHDLNSLVSFKTYDELVQELKIYKESQNASPTNPLNNASLDTQAIDEKVHNIISEVTQSSLPPSKSNNKKDDDDEDEDEFMQTLKQLAQKSDKK